MRIIGSGVVMGLAIAGWAGQARAQDVQVDVHVSPELVREVNRIVAEVVPEVTRGVQDAVAGLTRDLADARISATISLQNSNLRAEATRHEERRLTLGPNGSLELANVSGDIIVTAGSGRDTTVEINTVSRGRTDADAKLGLDRVTVEVDQRGERATVKTNYFEDRGRQPYQVSVTYTVTAPAGTHVTADSVSGNVRITGIHGDVEANAVGGSVTLKDVARLSAKTVGGDITITMAHTDGTFEAESIGGSVTADDVRARRVSVTTVGGNVAARTVTCDHAELGTMAGTVEFSGPLARNGRYEMHTQSGTIRFSPTGETGFELQANTFSGEVRSDIPLTSRNATPARGRASHSVTGTFGDGSAVVIATAFSGDVIVTKK
jgi:DUF4097 and DUF4098 domain-containing protein YvlB